MRISHRADDLLFDCRAAPSPWWHLDAMVESIGGKRMSLWRAVDDEGEVQDLIVQKGRDTAAAMKILKHLLGNQPVAPEVIVTDGLASYGAAPKQLGLQDRHRPGRLRENNRAENFAPADPPARAKNAALQIASFSSKVSHHPPLADAKAAAQKINEGAGFPPVMEAVALPGFDDEREELVADRPARG
jgi:transposase-like protein